MREENSSSGFRCDCDAQSHICNLQPIAEDIEVSDRENQGDNRGVCDGRRSGIVPRQEAREERVVVCELLACSSGCSRRCARSGEIREFGMCLSTLVSDVLRNGAYCNLVSIGSIKRASASGHTISDALGYRMVLDCVCSGRGI